MKITDIIKPNESKRLYHPTIGHVKWDDLQDGQGFSLYFAIGPERNQMLGICESVLFGTDWNEYPEPWKFKLGRVADQCIACGTRDTAFLVSSHPKFCLHCFAHSKKPNKHLVKRLEKLEKEAIIKWCKENNLDPEWEMTIFS